MTFPPTPNYPKELDDDSTLYLVHNTTESKLAVDNPPWSQEIEIVPVEGLEIWADNGFGNISGELFYYDSVQKNSNGKVEKLKNCARNLGGDKTRHNKKNTMVRGFVIAEHHNQLVDAIINMEKFTGINFDTNQETLDWRIRNLESLAVIFDDYNCPDVNFTFNITETDNETGILATYDVDITTPASFTKYRLDFGDGEFTTTSLSGTHRYALNSRIDPVITLSNDKCEIVQTPIERDNPAEPTPIEDTTFTIPFPETPTIPDFNFVPCEVPEPEVNLPPLVLPCVETTDIPDINISDINIPDNIELTGIDLPSVITVDGPSIIVVDPPIPPTVIVDPPIPPTIVVLPPESNISLDLNIEDMPALQVDWGMPPEMEIALTMAKPVRVQNLDANAGLVEEFGEEFADLFEAQDKVKVGYETVGIPTEIQIVPPVMPKIQFDENFPTEIKVSTENVDIPTDIQIHGPESPIPDQINITGVSLPDEIEVINKGVPDSIDVINIDVPKTISVEMDKDIPNKIVVEQINPIPDKIDVNGSIVLEVPESIPVTGFPDGIPLIAPEEGIPLTWTGAPVELKISMGEMLSKDSEGRDCFYLTPCPK